MESVPDQYGLAVVAVVIAVWVFEKIWRVVKPPKSEAILRDILAALTDMKQKVVELHEWHNVSDNEGMKVWYERHALIKQLVGLATDIKSAVATVLGKIELIGQKINSKK